MRTVEVNHLVKAYRGKTVVNDLSFSVLPGNILGLIGPNGAGKTTTIRMILDIIKPDSGTVSILGKKMSEAGKDRLGYLPEERGLYKKLTVIDSIIYLASLKGIDRQTAETRADELLGPAGMLSSKEKKIEELSRGMGQIIQFLVTIIHEPDLIILDEPFSGLDPINTDLLKKMLFDLKARGKAVILSTHQMNQVEELCDRIVMIYRGQAVLYGDLGEIKARYRTNSVLVDFDGELETIRGVAEMRRQRAGRAELILAEGATPARVLKQLIETGISIKRFEAATPSLNDIFLKVVEKSRE